MAVTVQDIRAKFPEFKSCDVGIAAEAITEAECNINATAWGALADLGTKYLAAHLIKLATKGDSLPGGPPSQLKIGDASASFAVPRGGVFSDPTLMRTVYGMRYLGLRRQIFPSRVL